MGNFLSNNQDDLARALEDSKREIEERESQNRASSLGLQYINLQNFPMDLMALGVFSEQEAQYTQSVPFYKDKHDLRVGTFNPNNSHLKVKLLEISQDWNVTTYLISESSYKGAMKFYSKVVRPTNKFQDIIQFTDADPGSDLQAVIDTLGVSASDVLNKIFGAAVAQGSSDIHLEPEENIVKVRFRIDGVLHDVAKISKTFYPQIVSRIKLQAKLKLNVENESQDGRFSVMNNNVSLDVRVSILPSVYDEAIVLRLLGVGAVDLKIKDLGLSGKALDIVKEQIQKPNGMVLTTGPTGSGKTTTLYAFLQELNEPGVKIITLEDPVEYKISGIQQTPIDHRIDFSFVKGLRAILRQDPDILMVGEIRDPETAETALQAALTGHVVLSTLHTNDAAGAVPRLITMGVKPFTIAPALNAVIAQRLVRRLCGACIQSTELSKELLGKVTEILNDIPKTAEVNVPNTLQFYHSAGCKECNNLGYKGRVGVYEVIEINDEMRELILKDPSIIDIKKLAKTNGTMTMAQDGLMKALSKITDVEEVFRVVG